MKNTRKVLLLGLVLIMSGLAVNSFAFQKGKDTTKTKKDSVQTKDTGTTGGQTQLQIDTTQNQIGIDTQQTLIDTSQLVDSTLIEPVSENKLTNLKLFLYITLSVLGLALFYYIFVQMLFKTFHKSRGTRQSMLLSWNLFFAVSIVWLFIIWGVVAEFWTSAAFMVTMIFLFIVSLVMLIISVKSK
jgi:membrane-associated HD superfamily phosphohydrolase